LRGSRERDIDTDTERTTMAKKDRIPSRHPTEEADELFPERTKDVSLDVSDSINEGAWGLLGDTYTPAAVTQDRDGSGWGPPTKG
jgi:hypothetical protein